MQNDQQASYVLSGVLKDGAPYRADGALQPDGSVLFQILHDGRITNSTIDIFGDRPKGQFVIEKVDAKDEGKSNIINLATSAGRKRWHR